MREGNMIYTAFMAVVAELLLVGVILGVIYGLSNS